MRASLPLWPLSCVPVTTRTNGTLMFQTLGRLTFGRPRFHPVRHWVFSGANLGAMFQIESSWAFRSQTLFSSVNIPRVSFLIFPLWNKCQLQTSRPIPCSDASDSAPVASWAHCQHTPLKRPWVFSRSAYDFSKDLTMSLKQQADSAPECQEHQSSLSEIPYFTSVLTSS